MTATGGFIWYELITPDPVAAERFYGEVVGWTFAGFGGGTEYRVIQAAGEGVGGLLAMPTAAASAGMRPGWFGYLQVGNVDAAVEQALAAGGEARMPATDIPGVGRIAMLTDPQGAAFYVMAPAGEGVSRAFEPQTPGHVAWNELSTSDAEAALAFYARQFGLKEGGRMPMGPAGDYVMLHVGDTAIGGLMRSAPGAPSPAWQFYTHVTGIDALPDRIRAAGGEVIVGPMDVPGGSRALVAHDPHGAAFGLVGPA